MLNRKLRVLLIEDNIVSARLVEGMLAHADGANFQVHRAETLLATLDLLAKFEFDIALLDLTLPDSQGLETFLTVHRHAPALPVIVVTGIDDESIALTAVRQGAQDYIVKGDLKAEKLIRALNYAIARTQKPADGSVPADHKAPLIGLMGSKGGVGTTTLACHWALELRKQTGESVLLADLDPSTAASSFLMKVSSSYTLTDAALNLHRLDKDLWDGMACHTAQGVDLLQAPGAHGINDPPPAERVRHVLRFAQLQYRWMVVDLGRLSASSFTILEEASDLLIVTTADLTGLNETGRLIRRLIDAGIPRENMKLILNRNTKGKSISSSEIENALGYPCYASIGDFSEELDEVYASGNFLEDTLKLRKEIAKVLMRWRGVEEKQAPAAGLGFLRRLIA